MCRCGGAVYEAEKVTMKEQQYHKKCFTCHRCCRALDALSVGIAQDNEIYCKVWSFERGRNNLITVSL